MHVFCSILLGHPVNATHGSFLVYSLHDFFKKKLENVLTPCHSSKSLTYLYELLSNIFRNAWPSERIFTKATYTLSRTKIYPDVCKHCTTLTTTFMNLHSPLHCFLENSTTKTLVFVCKQLKSA